MFVPNNKEKIKQECISKCKLDCPNQVILLMITGTEKWYDHAIRSLSKLSRGIMSKNNGVYFSVNCIHPFRTANELKSHENVCMDHDYYHRKNAWEKKSWSLVEDKNPWEYCSIPMPAYNPYLKNYPHAIIILKNHTQEKQTNKQTNGLWLFIWQQQKQDGNPMKKFLINFEKKNVASGNERRKERQKNENFVTYAEKNPMTGLMIMKNTIGFMITVVTQESIEVLTHSICNLRYKRPVEVPVVFHNDSNYDYHFIIKELIEESEGQVWMLMRKDLEVHNIGINKRGTQRP